MNNNEFLISAVIPIKDEEATLVELSNRLIVVLKTMGPYEIIFVNDCSHDKSEMILSNLCNENKGIIKNINLKSHCGKATALQIGFNNASGRYIVMLDGDLQDQPEEIPNLLKILESKNVDVVTGWKKKRFDSISKKLPSRIFNFVVRRLSGLNVHDFNCGLKIMKRECAKSLKLYGQLHRFLLLLLQTQGFKIMEAEITHAPRLHGLSKYGSRRYYEGIMDLLTVIFITRYLGSPLYFFGYYGLSSFIFAFIIAGYYIPMHFYSYLYNIPKGMLSEHPLWLLSPIFFIIGLIFIFFGLLGQMIVHQTRGLPENTPHHLKIGF